MYLADYDLECHREGIRYFSWCKLLLELYIGRVTCIDNQLVAFDTILGRVLSGSFQPLPPMPPASVNVLSTHVLKISSESSVIRYDKLEKFWYAESVVSDLSNNERDFNISEFMGKICLMEKDIPYR